MSKAILPVGNVIFDLDGTLTDPGLGIVRSIRHVMRELGRPEPPLEQLRACVGPPLRDNFVGLLGPGDPVLIERAVEIYRERTGRVGIYENEVYPGAAEMLTALRASGRNLLIATSRPRVYAEPILQHFGLNDFFSAKYCAELDGRNSDKSELIALLLEREQLAPADCLMIGDRKHDIVGAKANGIAAAGVTYGYGSEEELRNAGADHLCANPEAVTELLIVAKAAAPAS